MWDDCGNKAFWDTVLTPGQMREQRHGGWGGRLLKL